MIEKQKLKNGAKKYDSTNNNYTLGHIESSQCRLGYKMNPLTWSLGS